MTDITHPSSDFDDIRMTMDMMRKALNSSETLNSNIAYGCITLIHKQLLDVPQEILSQHKDELNIIRKYVEELRGLMTKEKDIVAQQLQQADDSRRASNAYSKSTLAAH